MLANLNFDNRVLLGNQSSHYTDFLRFKWLLVQYLFNVILFG